jgi:TLC ATP/ADP transporter
MVQRRVIFSRNVVLCRAYGMCINIVEVSWKAKLKLAFPDRKLRMPNLDSRTNGLWIQRTLTPPSWGTFRRRLELSRSS